MSGRKIQDADVKTAADITGAGGTIADLTNDTKIYVSALSINKQLSQAIIDGDIASHFTSDVAYTPIFTGFGTVVGIEVFSHREGQFLVGRGKFTAGIPTAVEARMSLGFNGVNGSITSANTTYIPSIALAGYYAYDNNAVSSPTILMEPSVGYITFGQQTAGSNGLTKQLGTTTVVTGGKISFFFKIPISGW